MAQRLDFQDIPKEMIWEVLIRLTPDKLGLAGRTSKLFNKISASAWQKKVEAYFPDVTQQHFSNKPTNWQEIFKQAYQKQYNHLTPRQSKLFFAFKENNHVAILELAPTIHELLISAQDNVPIIFQTTDKKILSNLYYQLIHPYYSSKDWDRQWDKGKRTILYWAISCHIDINEIEMLIKYKLAHINEIYFDNTTVLETATEHGRVDVIDLLKNKYGARIDYCNNNNQTLLHLAAAANQPAVIAYLVDNGLDLNIAIPTPPIAIAARHGHVEALDSLLKKGANATIKFNTTNRQAIHEAAAFGQVACVKRLALHDKHLLVCQDDEQATPLHVAIYHGHKKVVTYLLTKSVPVDGMLNAPGKSYDEKDPLLLAVEKKNWDIISELLNAGANPSLLIDKLFLIEDYETIINLLELNLSKLNASVKSNISSHPENGRLLLAAAVENNKLAVLKWLFDNGVDLNIGSPTPPLAIATSEGHVEALDWLLKNGANAAIKFNTTNRQAIHEAAARGHLACIRRLALHDESLLTCQDDEQATPLHVAIYNGKKEIVAPLLAKKVPVDGMLNAPGKLYHKKTPLLLAAEKDDWDIVSNLLNAGANPELLVKYLLAWDNAERLEEIMSLIPAFFSNEYKNALLLTAISNNKPKAAACLLSLGADAHQANEHGHLPIHLAAMRGHLSFIKKLFEFNKKLIAVPCHSKSHFNNAKTALFLAHENKHINIVTWLLQKMSRQQLLEELLLAIQKNNLGLAKTIIDHHPTVLQLVNSQNKTPLAIAAELKNQAAIDLCYKRNNFEEGKHSIFIDRASRDALNNSIRALNNDLQKEEKVNINLMLESQALIRTLNNQGISPEEKITAVEAYRTQHAPISGAKTYLCMMAIVAIGIAVALACMLAGMFIGAALTSWSGPGVAAGSFFGALNGAVFGWQWGVAIASGVAGIATSTTLSQKFSFFGDVCQQFAHTEVTRRFTDDAVNAIEYR